MELPTWRDLSAGEHVNRQVGRMSGQFDNMSRLFDYPTLLALGPRFTCPLGITMKRLASGS